MLSWSCNCRGLLGDCLDVPAQLFKKYFKWIWLNEYETNMTAHIKQRQKLKVVWNKQKNPSGWQISSSAPVWWGMGLWKCYLYRRNLQKGNTWGAQVGRLNLAICCSWDCQTGICLCQNWGSEAEGNVSKRTWKAMTDNPVSFISCQALEDDSKWVTSEYSPLK